MLSCSLLEQCNFSNHGIAKTATYLSRDSVANVITKYADQLILGIRGCVCGISSSSLKMILKFVSLAEILKLSKPQKLPWFDGAP